MSRAAFKLMEMNQKHHLFKPGMTVVDLGFAPGSWSQVAFDKTRPGGRVIGVDILPCRPPRGVSSIQGNFLSKTVQDQLKLMLADPKLGRAKEPKINLENESYIEMERNSSEEQQTHLQQKFDVDLVLSDMCDPWPQTSGFWLRSINDPYIRLMNTSGNITRDHAYSIVCTDFFFHLSNTTFLTFIQDLCDAALMFALDTLKPNGKFLCKFYTGKEDKYLEERMRKAFKHVKREKPDASRSASREMYLVGIGRLENATRENVFGV